MNDLLFVNMDKLNKVWDKLKKVKPAMRRGPEINARKTKKMLSMSNLCDALMVDIPMKIKVTERKVY